MIATNISELFHLILNFAIENSNQLEGGRKKKLFPSQILNMTKWVSLPGDWQMGRKQQLVENRYQWRQ